VTVTLEDDFGRFVAARWSDLEPVAHLVTLDRASARRITVDALADLGAEWRDLVDEGSPAAAARRSVMSASLLHATRRPRSPAGAPGVETIDAATSDACVAALLPVLRSATPVERAVLAARASWGLTQDETAGLLVMPPGPARATEDAVRSRLLAAHTAARVREGAMPAEWRFERDLLDAVDLLLGDQDDPPDPAELVGSRRGQVRRRSLLLGGGAAACVAALGGWAVREVGLGAASGRVPTPPGPGDPAWRSAATWPARGSLARDAGLAALALTASPGARLLFADDLPGRRVVVVGSTDRSGSPGTEVRLWTGREGAAPEELVETSLGRTRVEFADDVVPVVVPAPAQAGLPDLLVLARPPVLAAEYSTRVSYLRTGEVNRSWSEVRLTGGVATVPITSPVPPALRVRVDGYDGAAVGAVVVGLGPPDLSAPLAESLVEAVGPFVAACTGTEPSSLRHTVALEARVSGDLVDVDGIGGGGRVAVVHTRLPNGALLRSVRAAVGDQDPGRRIDLETIRPIRLADSEQPFAVRLPWYGARTGRFLVLAPGAARAQLSAIASTIYPTSEVTSLVDGAGILDVPDARLASVYRLVLWSSSGERLGAWRQVFRRGDPRDLWARPR
jgi:hypothetical protein